MSIASPSSRLPPNASLIPRQRPLPTTLMIHHRLRIPILLRHIPRTSPIRIMHRLPLHILQLRHPLPDVLALRIELLALQQRIEDAKIRLRVDADAGREAPAAVVAREVAVDQVLHEVALAEAPVEQQVLRQEGRDDHAAPVVHVGGRVHLAHGGVDDGEAGGAGGPAREVVVVVLPLDVGVFVFEGLGHAATTLVISHRACFFFPVLTTRMANAPKRACRNPATPPR